MLLDIFCGWRDCGSPSFRWKEAMRSLPRLAVRALPGPLSASLTIALANRSIRPPAQPAEQAALQSGERFAWGPGGRLAGWAWGRGPLVVLVHGWGGRAAQMAPLASALAAAGFRAVALEVTGHGESAGRSSAWSCFVRDLAAFAASLREPVHAFVAHSAGGLATMAARRQGRIVAERFVCIAAPSHPYPPVRGVAQRLDPPPAVLQRYRHYLAAELGLEWQQLEDGAAWRGAGRPLLLVHDENDRFVAHTEADRIAAVCEEATVLKTRGYSHTRVLRAPETLQAVPAFLAGHA